MSNWPGWRRNVTQSFTFDMRRILHIITGPPNSLGAQIIRVQKENTESDVVVMEPGIKGTQDNPGGSEDPVYDELLEEIFKADSIQVW